MQKYSDCPMILREFLVYHETIKARSGGGANYPYISALGLLITLFIAPITFGIDTLLKKHGPSVD